MSDTEKIFGLVGHPLGHSFSREYFSQKFQRENVNAQYLNFDINSITPLDEIIKMTPNLCGLNVTIPYKQSVIPYLDELDATASEIGAVNVVKIYHDINGSKILKGFNSDYIGFLNSLKPYINKSIHSHALVLGTGGASLAVKSALRSLDISITSVSRSGKDGALRYEDVTPVVVAGHKVIVNCTPLGTWPNVDTCPDLPYGAVTAQHICFDLVYNPPVTEFLRRSKAQGATTINGLEMLHGQAEEAWKIWNE